MKESFKLWQNYQLFLEQPDFDPQSANFVDYANQNRDFILEKNQPSGTTAVVIPAFNEQRRIARTLAGVNQALQHFDQPIQLIVVDNASSDQTAEISQYFGATVVKEQKKGVGAARQTGLYSLDHNTQSVLTTDSDTVVAPFWITNHSQALSDPEVAFTFGPIHFRPDTSLSPTENLLFYSYLALRNFFQQCKYKYRTNHVEAGAANNAFNYHYAIDAGGYNPEMMKGEDSDLCNKLRPYGQVTKVGAPVISSARRQIGEGLSQAIATRIYLNVHRMLIGEVDSPNTMDDYR